MKMTLKMGTTNFELEFDGAEEACEFINIFIRNNPTASLLNLSRKEKREMLKSAAVVAAELLGIAETDPVLEEAVKVASKVVGLNYDN